MRFLLVDDDARISMLLMTFLKPHADCVVAGSGPQAMELFKKAMEQSEPFDVIFMDIRMPGMDGHETTRNLRQIEDDLGLPEKDRFKLVMVSGLDDVPNVTKSFFRGWAECYVTKPFTKAALLTTLEDAKILPIP